MKQTAANLAQVAKLGAITAYLSLDADGNLKVISQSSIEDPDQTALNVAADTLILAGKVQLLSFSVIVAGAAGALHDVATVGAAGAANKIATTPAVLGNYPWPWACQLGLVYKVGAGQTIAVQYRPIPAA